jgi:adenylate cyclase class IV
VEEPYEVEVKFPLTDTEAMKKIILQAGGVALNSEMQVDIY